MVKVCWKKGNNLCLGWAWSKEVKRYKKREELIKDVWSVLVGCWKFDPMRYGIKLSANFSLKKRVTLFNSNTFEIVGVFSCSKRCWSLKKAMKKPKPCVIVHCSQVYDIHWFFLWMHELQKILRPYKILENDFYDEKKPWKVILKTTYSTKVSYGSGKVIDSVIICRSLGRNYKINTLPWLDHNNVCLIWYHVVTIERNND